MRRPSLLLFSCLALTALGALRGLASFRQLVRFPLERYAELLKFPRPPGTDWVAHYRQPADLVDALERPLTALSLVLLILSFWLLGKLLNPDFRLLKPPDENPGQGAGAHVDLPLLFRAAIATLFSLWVLGALYPLAPLLGSPATAGAILLSGPPRWTAILPGVTGPLVQCVIQFPALWLMWGPGGLVTPRQGADRRAVLLWGLLAGMAALPVVLGLYYTPAWIAAAGEAFSLADTAGWRALVIGSVLAPAAAGALLALLVWCFHPRDVNSTRLAPFALGAAAALAVGVLAEGRVGEALFAMDARHPHLRPVLGVEPSNLVRFAIILTPRGFAFYSQAPDQTLNETGREDGIACRSHTIAAARKFLQDRRYRSRLALRAFSHIYDAAALNWEPIQGAEAALDMLVHAPTPYAARLLLERLANCPTSPEARRMLDRLADARQFTWPEPMGNRWLGSAYLRFGDNDRARGYLLKAQLNEQEMRGLLGGILPLPDGTITGQVTVRGKNDPPARVGLIPLDPNGEWRRLVGFVFPTAWSRVLTAVGTDKNGRFEFRHIPEGRYLLVVTGGNIGRFRGVPTATHPPGIIEVDRFRPVRKVPPFNLDFVPSPRAPAGEGSNTA